MKTTLEIANKFNLQLEEHALSGALMFSDECESLFNVNPETGTLIVWQGQEWDKTHIGYALNQRGEEVEIVFENLFDKKLSALQKERMSEVKAFLEEEENV